MYVRIKDTFFKKEEKANTTNKVFHMSKSYFKGFRFGILQILTSRITKYQGDMESTLCYMMDYFVL